MQPLFEDLPNEYSRKGRVKNTFKLEQIKKEKRELPDELKKVVEAKSLKIIGLPTNKNEIPQRKLMEENVIPRHSSSVIFNGKSNSGKSMLMIQMFMRPDMYGADPADNDKKYFDEIYLFSPTAHCDDLAKLLDVDEEKTCDNFDISRLDSIIAEQKEIIEEKGLLASPKIAIIFDDIQSDKKFMNSTSFTKCFIQCRHLSISTFVCCQSWNLLPRKCRLQANNVFFFPSSLSEVDILIKEMCPPRLTKQEFLELIQYATNDKFQFLHINMREPSETRFRKNLDTVLRLNK